MAKVAIDHETRTVSNDLRSLQSGISSAHGGAHDGFQAQPCLRILTATCSVWHKFTFVLTLRLCIARVAHGGCAMDERVPSWLCARLHAALHNDAFAMAMHVGL